MESAFIWNVRYLFGQNANFNQNFVIQIAHKLKFNASLGFEIVAADKVNENCFKWKRVR